MEDQRSGIRTAAESILINRYNPTIIDGIFDRLNMASLIALSRTSFKGHASWIEYNKRTFNIIRMLSKYIRDPNGFREMQKRSGAVVMGEAALFFLNRSAIPALVFNIAVHPSRASQVLRHLVFVQGFRLWHNDQWICACYGDRKELQFMDKYQIAETFATGAETFATGD